MKPAILVFLFLATLPVHGQQPPAARYAELCAGCHTRHADSFRASPLATNGSVEEIAAVIRVGRPGRGMPSFAGALPDAELTALAGWVRDAAKAAASNTGTMIGKRIEAEDLRIDRSNGYGITDEGSTRYLRWIDRGSHLCYEDVDLTGVRSIEYRYAKGEGEPPRRFALVAFTGDFANGQRIPLGEKDVPLTGGWLDFVDARIGLERELAGRYRLCIIGMGGGGVFHLDHFTLSDAPAANDGITLTFSGAEQTLNGGGHEFRLEKVGEVDGEVWSLDFLDAETILATQKSGTLWMFRRGERVGEIRGIPPVRFDGQGGLLSVRRHPAYARNGWIYLTFAEPLGKAGMLTIVRGRIRDMQWTDQETIYRAVPKFFGEDGAHFGARIAFDGPYLYFGIGDRGHQDDAQDLRNPFGKIHRIFLDGRVPRDNPFANVADALPTIWSYGHRNPQGLTTTTGHAVWSTEHGPKGGDELNLIRRGRNYGWPVVTHGINYDGTIVSNETHRQGIEPSRAHWSPSPGLSNLIRYEGRDFPRWRGHLLVACLAHQQLKLMKLDKGDAVVGEDVLFEGLGRIRDLMIGPDGALHVALNHPNGQLYRLVPVRQ
jgi:glucose/arabinose dehydrogenase/cytochrome c553